MRVIGTSALGLGLAGCIFAACTSTSPAASPGNPDTGTSPVEDAGTDAPSVVSDAAGDAPADAPEDAAIDSPGVDAAPLPFTVVGAISLAASPTAMVFNPVLNALYVAMSGTAGIAVIDGATNTVATTIAFDPDDAAAPYPIVQMAVDLASNTLYAADSNPAGQTLYVINGVTNAVTATIAIGSDLGMQVDSTGHLYVLGAGTLAIPDGGTAAVAPPTITVIDDATNDAAAPVVVSDQAVSPGTAFALDPLLNRLYLCGPNATQYSNGTTAIAAVDTLDLASALTPAGAQQSFTSGQAVACVAGWGGAAVVTGSGPAVDFLGTSPLALTSSFAPTLATGAGAVSPAKANVVVFGRAATGLEILAVTETTDGGVSVSLPPTPALADAGATAWRTVVVASASGGVMQTYLTYATTPDAGVATASVIYASIIAQ